MNTLLFPSGYFLSKISKDSPDKLLAHHSDPLLVLLGLTGSGMERQLRNLASYFQRRLGLDHICYLLTV